MNKHPSAQLSDGQNTAQSVTGGATRHTSRYPLRGWDRTLLSGRILPSSDAHESSILAEVLGLASIFLPRNRLALLEPYSMNSPSPATHFALSHGFLRPSTPLASPREAAALPDDPRLASCSTRRLVCITAPKTITECSWRLVWSKPCLMLTTHFVASAQTPCNTDMCTALGYNGVRDAYAMVQSGPDMNLVVVPFHRATVRGFNSWIVIGTS
jgi:hypothetical protein